MMVSQILIEKSGVLSMTRYQVWYVIICVKIPIIHLSRGVTLSVTRDAVTSRDNLLSHFTILENLNIDIHQIITTSQTLSSEVHFLHHLKLYKFYFDVEALP